MDTLLIILTFVFGVVVGSFLNVVSLRFNTGVGLGGRSKCMSCGAQLGWKELVPILSFLAQGGACRKCGGRISWQYPLIELMTGAVFALIFINFPPIKAGSAVVTSLHILAACLLVIITAYDVKHKIIPDQLVYAFGAIALIGLFVGGDPLWHMPGYGALLAGSILALPFALLWLISKGTWMGLGDAKLALGIGWMLGISGGVNAVILSFWIAAAAGITWMLFTYRRFRPRTEIPFGPYLILGMYLVLFLGIEVLDVGLLRELFIFYLL